MSALTGQPNSAATLPALIPTGQFAGHPPIPLRGLCILIGSKEGVEIHISSAALAPVHAMIVCSANGVYVRNLADFGTLLINGLAAHEQLLSEGETLQVGEFTFTFTAHNAAFDPPDMPPQWAFELNGAPAAPPAGRTALLGTAPECDLMLPGMEVSDRHAILFAADGGWHVRDLLSATGTFVNGRARQLAHLTGGEVIRIGFSQLRYMGVGPHRAPEPFVHRIEGTAPTLAAASAEAFFGGMPVELPELALPKGFGQVGVRFEERLPKPQPTTARAAEPSAPPADGFIPVNQSAPVMETVTAHSPVIAASALAPVSRGIPAVPRCKGPLCPRPDESDDAELEEIVDDPALLLNDAPFGGVPLGGTPEYSPESAEFAELFSTEVDDFSNDPFWTRDDDADAQLPDRPEHLSPDIPPTGTPGLEEAPASLPRGNDKSSLVPSELRRTPVGAAPPPATTGPIDQLHAPPPRRSRSQKVVLLRSLMAGSIVAAAMAVQLGVPLHTKLEGRLSYLYTPAPDSQQWKDFQADQLHRLADPALPHAAQVSLNSDHPRTLAGFLDGNGKQLAAVIAGAQFDGPNLVLTYTGTDREGDSQRLAAILHALYNSDADVIAAAADARKAVADWEPRVAARRQEMAELQRRMDQQKKIVDAAKGLAEQLAPLQAAATEAGEKFMASEQAIQTDLAEINLTNARLASQIPATPPAPAMHATTRATTQAAATTRPAIDDLEMDELTRQINDCAEQIGSLQAAAAAVDLTKLRQARDDARKNLTQNLKAADSILQNNSDVKDSIDSAGVLQTRVDGVIDQLLTGRESREKLLDLQRLLQQADRRHQRIVEDSDAKLAQLGTQLDAAQRKLTAAIARGSIVDAQTRPSTQESDAASARVSAAQRDVDEVLHSMAMRQQQLYKDDSAHLRDRIERLSDDAMAQLQDQRQLVVDTLGTLEGRLAATVTPAGLSDADTAALTKAIKSIRDLSRAQQDYATAIASADTTAQSLLTLQQQYTELTARADARWAVINAIMPRDEKERANLTARRDELLAHLPEDRQTMEKARADFAAQALADAETGLTVTAARKAQGVVDALKETMDVKAGDMAVMQRSRDDLAQALTTTVDLKMPTEASVKMISDDSNRRLAIMFIAVLAVAGGFGMLLRRERKPIL